MKIATTRDALLPSLLQISGVVERRQTLPILANVLLNAKGNQLMMTATDLEVELRTLAECKCDDEGSFTLPARKLVDINKALPEGASIEIEVGSEKAVVRSGKSRFTLGILAAQDFPSVEPSEKIQAFSVLEKSLAGLIEKTQFAMAQQDVRYYLNGMLLEGMGGVLRSVATDGHRLAIAEAFGEIEGDIEFQVILPRKAVLELARLLKEDEQHTRVELSSSHARFFVGTSVFTSKLIDGRFPDYQRVIPSELHRVARLEREPLKQALHRASILSNEKYRGIRLRFSEHVLQMLAHNPEQEEAEEEIDMDFQGEDLVIGFNVGYLIDVLGAIEQDKVEFLLRDASSSALIKGAGEERHRYVVMPMRL